jgi:hypothetical protein
MNKFEKLKKVNIKQNDPDGVNLENKRFFFHYSKVMFGELYGKLTSPVKVWNDRMYMTLNCTMGKHKQKSIRKFSFSLSSRDIEEVHIHFGRAPSFVAIETSIRFASFACHKIGSDVLLPESPDMRKRFILLTGERILENNLAGDSEQCSLINSLSSWSRVHLLSHKEATDMILQSGQSFPEWHEYILRRNLPTSTTTSTSNLNTLLTNSSTQGIPTNLDTFSFICHKVRFGKLIGRSLVPVRASKNRLYFTFNCVVTRIHKRSLEKYTFSVGPSDVSNVYVYVGHMPSFLVVQTTKKFADVVCTRIGQNVLSPGSPDPKKRYLFLMLDSRYSETFQTIEETKNQFVQFVHHWTRLMVLSSTEALELLRDLL